ncbi:MAG: ankyrin repeat domain-containing protein [Candidatus Dependentiae bacterium]|nr:ankyrin repeat domain-containing protein [Candidatus Dependentiae bacterium]
MKTIKYFIVATSLAASLGLVVNVYAGPGQSRLANAAQVVFTQFAEGIRLSNKDLWRAIYTDNIEGVTQALLDGAHINQLNQYGDTVLVLACSKGDTGIVELLLNNGADINQQDGHGDTPLLWACYKGHSAIVELLLNRSAHINQPNLYGSTPLKEACSKGHAGIVKRLAFHGATLSGR